MDKSNKIALAIWAVVFLFCMAAASQLDTVDAGQVPQPDWPSIYRRCGPPIEYKGEYLLPVWYEWDVRSDDPPEQYRGFHFEKPNGDKL